MRFHIRRLVLFALCFTCTAVILLNVLRPSDVDLVVPLVETDHRPEHRESLDERLARYSSGGGNNVIATSVQQILWSDISLFTVQRRTSTSSAELKQQVDYVDNIICVNWRHIYWPNLGKGENKGSVLLWYSCFYRPILMFLMRERLECRISILKHCLTRLWNDINQLTFVFPFAETRSIKWMWRQLTERIKCYWFFWLKKTWKFACVACWRHE